MTRVEFFAEGLPQTKGSARAFVRGGRAVVTNDNPKAKAWAAEVSEAAREAMDGRELLDGPLAVELVFSLPRPLAHSTSKGLRPTAPRYVSARPDVDKLARCALDALTGVVFGDDSQVARLVATKVYASGAAGAQVVVRGVDE